MTMDDATNSVTSPSRRGRRALRSTARFATRSGRRLAVGTGHGAVRAGRAARLTVRETDWASVGSAGSLKSVGSSGSILSIGSAGSILSIGSAGSILSIGSVGSIASVASVGSIGGLKEIKAVHPERALGVIGGAIVAFIALVGVRSVRRSP